MKEPARKAKRKPARPKFISREKLEAKRLKAENAILKDQLIILKDELSAYRMAQPPIMSQDLSILREFVAAAREIKLPDGCMLIAGWRGPDERMTHQTAIAVGDLKRTAEAVYRVALEKN